jgi:hypothetical protein
MYRVVLSRAAGVVALAIVAATLGVALAPSASVRAQGIGIAPGSVELEDALRGGEYLRTISVVNREASELTFRFTKMGEVGEWVSLHPPDDPSTTLDTIVVPPGGGITRVLLRILVPSDVANGPYEGSIGVQSVATGTPAAGASSVQIGVSMELDVNVTGTQNISGSVLDMYTYDTEVGYPLRIYTKFQNTGNVKAQPNIAVQVQDAQKAKVGETSCADTTVEPAAAQLIRCEWDTTGTEPGQYVANVAVSLGDNSIDTRDLDFEIFPVGTLSRQGVLEELTLENAPYPGAVADIAARFRNIGQIDTRAVFLGEVYYKAALIDTVSTPERLVEQGETVALEAFVEVPKGGTYTVRGKVNYEGKETEEKELTFDVRGPGGDGEGLPLWAWIVIGGGAVVGAVVVVGGSWALARRLLRLLRL